MSNNQSYLSENTIEREHLKTLVNKLSDEDLCHPLEAGWTVSAVLAHLTFWDQRALVLIEKWKRDGIGPSPIDADIVNEATRGLCLAISPRIAAQVALSSAAAIDEAIERIDPKMAEEIAAKGTTVHLNRADHRRLHIEQIQKALKYY